MVNNFINWGNGKLNTDPIPKIIWIYWEGDSELVRRCIHRIKILLPDYSLRILNNSNLKEFLPFLPIKNKELPLANYADLIRLALLRDFGGIWLDASILLINNLDWVYQLKQKYSPDLIGFFADSFTKNIDYPILENWFLASSKQNHFIKDWYNLYEKCYTSINPFDFFKKLKEDENKMQGIDDKLANYLICYLAAMQLMQDDHRYKILMLSANETAHYYNFKLKLKPHQLSNFFLSKKINYRELPFLIKFEKRGREAIDKSISNGIYSKKSLLYSISPDSNYNLNKLPRYLNYIQFVLSNLRKKYLA